MSRIDHIEEREYASAKEFFDQVVFAERRPSLFRGMRDSRFDLKPTIARLNTLQRLRAKDQSRLPNIHGLVDATSMQIWCYQRFLMRTYYQAVTRGGGSLPPIDDDLHDQLFGAPGVSPTRALPRIVGDASLETSPTDWPLLAKMQHVGIETRLLDWSLSPLSAMFFAADLSTRESESEAPHIVVWEFDPTCSVWASSYSTVFWTDILRFQRMEASQKHLDVGAFVYAPNYSGNSNMRAQRGVFTVTAHKSFGGLHALSAQTPRWEAEHEDRYDFQNVYGRMAALYPQIPTPPYGEKPAFVPLIKHLLPGSSVGDLRPILDRVEVAESQLFLDGGSYREVLRRRIDDWLNSEDWLGE